MIVEEILRYLTEHPDAKDAAEGIKKYWIPGGCTTVTGEELENSLHVLVQRGWLLTCQSGVTPTLYQLNKDRITEILRFLERSHYRQRRWS